MITKNIKAINTIGYAKLIKEFNLKTLPHFRSSYTTNKGQGSIFSEKDQQVYIYPAHYAVGEGIMDNIEFALKHDGINLEILNGIFHDINPKTLTKFIKEHPASKYSRKLWYLYEFLTGKELNLPNTESGNYVEVLNEELYITGAPFNSTRHRVADNMLGDKNFCPAVRKTELLNAYITKNLAAETIRILNQYPEDVVRKASQYLFTKETITSFNIERETPSQQRITRFINLLQDASLEGELISKELLLKVQNNVVADKRFIMSDYRTSQNYVGQSIGMGNKVVVHYIPPAPTDVPALMDGLLKTARRSSGVIDPVIQAAVIAFGQVYIHPFDDGNGRTHRYIIHHILRQEGFTPEDTIIPISASMLANMKMYDNCLESLSKKIMPLLDFKINERCEITVMGKSDHFYKYMDLTHAAEYLYKTVDNTIHKEFIEEIDYLLHRTQAVKSMQNILDMPNKLNDLFIKLVVENGGALSKSKRKSLFHKLSNSEITQMEAAVRESFHLNPLSSNSKQPVCRANPQGR